MKRIITVVFILLSIVSCEKSITDSSDNRNSLYGTWISDTITTDDNYISTLSRKVINKEVITIRLTNSIAELSYKTITCYSSTSKDSVWGTSVNGPNTRNAENWMVNNDSITMSNVIHDWNGTKESEFKFKYVQINQNELWIWSTAVDCDLPNCMLWTWFKCKRIN